MVDKNFISSGGGSGNTMLGDDPRNLRTPLNVVYEFWFGNFFGFRYEIIRSAASLRKTKHERKEKQERERGRNRDRKREIKFLDFQEFLATKTFR